MQVEFTLCLTQHIPGDGEQSLYGPELWGVRATCGPPGQGSLLHWSRKLGFDLIQWSLLNFLKKDPSAIREIAYHSQSSTLIFKPASWLPPWPSPGVGLSGTWGVLCVEFVDNVILGDPGTGLRGEDVGPRVGIPSRLTLSALQQLSDFAF